VLENLGGWEILGLILVALFVIGPERLPKVLADGMALLRKVRSMASNATGELSRELGTNIELEDLHPKTFLRKHLLSEAEEDALRKPFQEIFRDVSDTAKQLEDSARDAARDVTKTAREVGDTAASIKLNKLGKPDATPTPPAIAYRFDDAT
jgi:sec-independent protein translocase protein TatB